MADPRIEMFKRFALQQAAMQQPQMAQMSLEDPNMLAPSGASDAGAPAATPSMANPVPNVGQPNTQVQQQPSPQAAGAATPGNPGPIKSFLSQFLYGAGQGLLTKVGLPTDAEKQQVAFSQQQATQNAAAQNELRQAQIRALDVKNQLVDLKDYNIPGLEGMALMSEAPKIVGQHLLAKGRVDAQQERNKGAITVQGMKGDTAETIQGQKGAQQQIHDATVAGVQRDIANGKLGMAAARLSLARQVAAAKADGTYETPTADRLRRGDLANNAQTNLDHVITQVQANPDLFGQIVGHFTTVQEMMGSSNPAIREMAIEIHNAALASNGAHGLRSAQAVPDTERVMLNHFRDNPETAVAGLKAMQDSLDTFIEDAQHGKHFVPRGTAPSSPKNSGGIPEYIRGADGKLVLKTK